MPSLDEHGVNELAAAHQLLDAAKQVRPTFECNEVLERAHPVHTMASRLGLALSAVTALLQRGMRIATLGDKHPAQAAEP
eukprot:4572861-Prymnesium_polylepis.2